MRLALLFLLVVFATACGKSKPQQSAPLKPLVLVSVGPYQHFAARIVGELLDVASIVPPGANAHTFEPTPRYRDELGRATVWFRIGEPFERPLLPLLKDKLRIVDLRDGINLIDLEPGHVCNQCGSDHLDRHIWMSPLLSQLQAKAMEKALSEEFPDHRAHFEKNLQTLLADLAALDAEIRHTLGSSKERTLLVSHPAFGYFCREYSLEQLSVEHEGKDPRPKYLEAVLEGARKKRPGVAIALPQHNNKGAQMIAQELHLPIKMIDPYSQDYFEAMRTLTEWIVSKP